LDFYKELCDRFAYQNFDCIHKIVKTHLATEFGKSHSTFVELGDDAATLEDDSACRDDPQIHFEDHRRGEVPNRRPRRFRHLHRLHQGTHRQPREIAGM